MKDLSTQLYHTLQTEILNHHLGTNPNFGRTASRFRASAVSGANSASAAGGSKYETEKMMGNDNRGNKT
jgi:hypothetical protein